MKKTFFLLPLIFLMSCGIFKTLTVDRLQLGMSRADVENIFGRPEKVLIVSMTDHGCQEILAHIIGNDVYMLEFLNDQLIRYEFLSEDVVYAPSPPPLPPPPFHTSQPVRPAPDVRPPVSRPSPSPSVAVDPGNRQRETQSSKRPGRRPGSGRTVQEQTNERERSTTSETNRTERRNASRPSNRNNNRSSESSTNNRQTED